MRPPTLHDWRVALDLENAEAGAPWWGYVYRRLWQDLERLEVAPRGSREQRAGIDRWLTLADGRRVSVQEKVRNGRWQDLLIETGHVSTDGRSRPGWIHATTADRLLVVWRPLCTARCWDVRALQRAWRLRGAGWQDCLGVRTALNRGGYATINVPVPLSELPPCETVQIPAILFRSSPGLRYTRTSAHG